MAKIKVENYEFEYDIGAEMFWLDFMGQRLGFVNYREMEEFLKTYVKSIHYYQERKHMLSSIEQGVEAE